MYLDLLNECLAIILRLSHDDHRIIVRYLSLTCIFSSNIMKKSAPTSRSGVTEKLSIFKIGTFSSDFKSDPILKSCDSRSLVRLGHYYMQRYFIVDVRCCTCKPSSAIQYQKSVKRVLGFRY